MTKTQPWPGRPPAELRAAFREESYVDVPDDALHAGMVKILGQALERLYDRLHEKDRLIARLLHRLRALGQTPARGRSRRS